MRIFRHYALLVTLLCGGAGCQNSGFMSRWWGGEAPPTYASGAPFPGAPGAQGANPYDSLYGGKKPRADQTAVVDAFERSKERLIKEHLEKGYQAEAANNLDQARRSYEQAIADRATDQDAFYAHHRLATVLDRQKRFTEAEKHYQQAYQLNPSQTDMLSDWGYSKLLQGRTDEAESLLKLALQKEGGHRKAAFNLGVVYAQKGDYQRAYEYCREGGSDEEARAVLAQFSPQGGQWAQRGPTSAPQVAPQVALPSTPLSAYAVTPEHLANPFTTGSHAAVAGPATPVGQAAPTARDNLSGESEATRQLRMMIEQQRLAQSQAQDAASLNSATHRQPGPSRAAGMNAPVANGPQSGTQISGYPPVTNSSHPPFGNGPQMENGPTFGNSPQFGNSGMPGGGAGFPAPQMPFHSSDNRGMPGGSQIAGNVAPGGNGLSQGNSWTHPHPDGATVQASGTQPAPSGREAYEQATRTAAQLGLSAGTGAMSLLNNMSDTRPAAAGQVTHAEYSATPQSSGHGQGGTQPHQNYGSVQHAAGVQQGAIQAGTPVPGAGNNWSMNNSQGDWPGWPNAPRPAAPAAPTPSAPSAPRWRGAGWEGVASSSTSP